MIVVTVENDAAECFEDAVAMLWYFSLAGLFC